MKQEGLQGSVPLRREHSSTQRRWYQLSPMRPDELRSLRRDANEMQGQKVGLVYDPLVLKQFILVIIRRLDDLEHLLDHGAGQVASCSQLQPTCLRCSSKQAQGVGRDRRSGNFRIGEVGFETDRVVTSEGW